MTMKMKNDFAAFILTHGRPDHVVTYNSLKKCGYTGPIYIVIDNEDSKVAEYREKYGDKVYVFDKLAISRTFDEADNFSDRRSIVYARNAVFNIAEKIGVKYFIQLDDDYTDFRYKYDNKQNYGDWYIKNLDGVFDAMIEFYKKIPALSIAMAQGGDFIGGKFGGLSKKIGTKRKCMNTFICSTDRRFTFFGRINEDVNAYTLLGSRGKLFLQINQLAINQLTTQQNKGGMTDIYLTAGTYIKSFYTIIHQPSSVRIAIIGSKYKRLHHKVKWNNTVPKIIREP
jgi:hypothetical protein